MTGLVSSNLKKGPQKTTKKAAQEGNILTHSQNMAPTPLNEQKEKTTFKNDDENLHLIYLI